MFTQTLPTWMPRLSFAPVTRSARRHTSRRFPPWRSGVLNMVVPHGEDAYYQLRPLLGIRKTR